MKTLHNHQLFFDQDCPFCNWYSTLFMKIKMLSPDGAKPFQEVHNHAYLVKLEKARNQIPLIDLKKGKVYYGIDSLLVIISYSFPWVYTIARIRPIYWLLLQLYNIISFNRKVIFPYQVCSTDAKSSCSPSFHTGYRWLFILLCLTFSTYIFYFYSLLLGLSTIPITITKIFFIAGAEIVYLSIMLYFFSQENKLEYLGQMGLIYFIGALMMCPVLVINLAVDTPTLFNIIYLGLVCSNMFFLHVKRVKVTGYSWLMTSSWVIFKICLVLYFLATYE